FIRLFAKGYFRENVTTDTSTDISDEPPGNMFNCPKENCKGVLNDDEGEKKVECKLCSSIVCRKCRSVTNSSSESHKCDPNLVANLKSIKNETKPCPKCFSPIF